jgi:hypothetical protein
MPIKSYLVHPAEGRSSELKTILSGISECEIINANQENIFILLTDTPDLETEKALEERLAAIPSLQFLTLVSGFDEMSGVPL